MDENNIKNNNDELTSYYEELVDKAGGVAINKIQAQKKRKLKKLAQLLVSFIVFIVLISLGFYFQKRYITEIIPEESDREIIAYFGPVGPELASGGYYFQYNNNIYYAEPVSDKKIHKLPDADLETFEMIDENYQRDKNFVYYAGKKIDGADPETFQPLQWPYAKDKNRVYNHLLKTFWGADPETFEILKCGYRKDKNSIYYYNYKVAEADAETFKVLFNCTGRDKNNTYKGTKTIKSY